MASAVDHLLGQVEHAAEYNGMIFQYMLQQGETPQDLNEQAGGLACQHPLSQLMEGYSEDADGLAVIAVNNYVIATDTDRLQVTDDTALSDIFDKDILAAMRQSAIVGELERTIYLAPSDSTTSSTLFCRGPVRRLRP